MTEKINVTITGGAPWGFRLQGGGKISLVVHKIRPKSKSQGVLREGDEIKSVNEINVENMTYDEVMNLVDNSGNELKIQLERLAYQEKLPPSEIARQQGTLKRPRKQQSDSTTESYKRSYTTPDGYQVNETKIYQTSESHQEEHFSQATPVRCHTKVIKLPEDIIKRSSIVKSPDFDLNREITSPVQSVERKTTTIKREYHGHVESTSGQKTPVLESSVKDKPAKDNFSLSNMSPVVSKTFTKSKQESFVPQFFTIGQSESSTSTKQESVTSGSTRDQAEWPAKPAAKIPEPVKEEPKEEVKAPEAAPSDELDTKTIKAEKQEQIKTIEEPAEVKEESKPTEEAPKSASLTVKSVSRHELSDGGRLESVTTETIQEGTNEVSRTIDTKTQTMYERNNEGTLPKDHVTNEIGPECSTSSQSPAGAAGPIGDNTTMPGVTIPSHSSPSLFKVSKFSSETQSNYSWSPSSQKSTFQKNGNTSTKRYSGIYEGRPTPPLPPPTKPPRPVSAPDLGDKMMTFSEQIKQEICTPERRNAAEGEDRRSVSLEMIKKALIPPPEEELKETLITKTKKKMFSSSSFYEEPNAIYPTVEEQFDLAQKIANSLSADTNRKSKGSDMFIKRVKKSDKWIHESPSPEIISTTKLFTTKSIIKSDNTGSTTSTTIDKQVFSSQANGSDPDLELGHYSKLKPVLNPTRPQDSQMFKGTDREFKTQGLALSPHVCAELVQDLNNFKGKGAQIFAKRRKKSEKWVVDDSNVSLSQSRSGGSGGKVPPAVPPKPNAKDAAPQNRLNSMIQEDSWMQQKIKYVKSPWEAALESPIGSCDAAFEVTKRKYVPPLPKAPTEIINARLPSMVNIEKSVTPPRVSSSTLYKPKVPRGWARSVHDPTSSDLLGCTSDMEAYPDSDTEFAKRGPSPSNKYGNYNTLPRSWGRTKKDSSSFRPVRTSLYSAA